MTLLNDFFRDLTILFENDNTIIYKATRTEDGLPVKLKTYKKPDNSFRIKHEYDILNGKEIAGADKALGVSYNDDKSYLISHDTGSIVLDSYIMDKSLDTAEFLRLARQAALSLATIHEADIVHCDVKPANMLVHPDTMNVTYIDFGISFSIYQRRDQQGGYFAGTLEFMAPEQTGRLNMVVDTRSDLYSLGITLYYLLSHRLPFVGENAAEIIHAQTVLPPPPLSQYVTADPTIEDIILRLLEKSPKKRYQSAASLAYDLELCINSLEKDGVIVPFILGEKDVFASLEPGQRLFGKEKDLENLAAEYENTHDKQRNLVLLHGLQGSGKSSLLDAFVVFAEENNAYLLRSSVAWQNSAVTYSGLQSVFHNFELYAYKVNLPLSEYRQRLLDELEENAGVLLEILPSFAGILGDLPKPRPLDPAAAAERARLVFIKTIQVLSQLPYPLVLVLDGVEHADDGSLDLLLSAIENPDTVNCLVVLCYQDSNPVFLQRLSKRIAILDRTLPITDIVTKYLTIDQINHLLESLFDFDDNMPGIPAGALVDTEGAKTRALAGILYDATDGVVEKLRTALQKMYRDRQLQYDAAKDKWSVDLSKLDADLLKGMTSRYHAEFDALSSEDQNLLAMLSCVGECFHTSCGSLAVEMGEDEFEKALFRLKDAGWLILEVAGEGTWSFRDKAGFDLCYESIDRAQQLTIHRQIVDNLYPVHKLDYEVMLAHGNMFMRQMLATGREGYDPQVIHDIAQCQLTIASQYLQTNNMQQALLEFENGLALLGGKPFEADYTVAYEMFLQYAMCCYAVHEEARAMEIIDLLLDNAQNEDDTYQIYDKTVNQYLARAEWDLAIVYARRYLGANGLLLPEDANHLEAGRDQYQNFLDQWGASGLRLCLNYPYTTDKDLERHGNMLVMMAKALSFCMDDATQYYLYLAVNMAMEHMSLFTKFIHIFPVAAAQTASIHEYKQADDFIMLGVELAEKIGADQALLWCVYGNMVTHWVNPLNEILEVHKKAKHHAMLEGNAFFEAYADMMLLNYNSFVGEELNAYHGDTMKVLHNLDRLGMQALKPNFITFRQYARCLLGRTIDDSSFDDSQFQEASLEKNEDTWYGLFNKPFYYVYRLRACYIHLDFDTAIIYAEKYRDFVKEHNMSAYLIHVQFYYYYSMTLLEVCRLHPERREEYMAQIEKNQVEQTRIAQQNPTNFYIKTQLVDIGIRCLDHHDISLIDGLGKVHAECMSKGLIWDTIFVERLAGNFWAARGNSQYEIIHKNNRLVHYKDIGAKVSIRILGEPDEDSLLRKREARDRERREDAARGIGLYTSQMRTLSSVMVTQFESSIYHISKSGHTGLNAALDFEALLHALEQLMCIDNLPLLIQELAELLFKSDNAEKVYLFLAEDTATQLCAAKYAIENTGVFIDNELPLALGRLDDTQVPKHMVRQVIERGEPICANSASNEYRRKGDPYLNAVIPESFLCLPITQGEDVLGVVYMENASLPGAFPEGRVQYLSALVRQSSALIQNQYNNIKIAEYTKDLEERLSSYLAQQNALIAGIAHEINSPVGVCLTVATKIHEKTVGIIDAYNQKQLGMRALLKYLEETRDGLDIVSNNVMRAGDLVQNFKKMSVEQSTEVFEIMELGSVLRNIVEYVRPGVKKKVNTVDVDVPENLKIYSSSGVLAQIFTNLIMNSAIHAFEHTPKEQNRIRIHIIDRPETDEIEMRYSDNGSGMDQETKDKVFQPFFTTKRNRGGSGLGGHIVLTCITQQLRGSVMCESEKGQGTQFIIRMPKSKPVVQKG